MWRATIVVQEIWEVMDREIDKFGLSLVLVRRVAARSVRACGWGGVKRPFNGCPNVMFEYSL